MSLSWWSQNSNATCVEKLAIYICVVSQITFMHIFISPRSIIL